MPEPHDVKVSGTVEDVFAHRFILHTAKGKLLADLTPKGAEQVKLKVGDEIAIEGEQKPSEIKIRRLTKNGKVTEIHHPEKHGPGHHDAKHLAHDPAAALKSVRSSGYEVVGKPRGKPKHFEVLAQRAGEFHELHVEIDGHIRKSKPVHRGDEKWAAELG